MGRTVQVWNAGCRGPHFEQPWLLRTFDQLRWFPVSADELLDMREAQGAGALPIRIDDTSFRLIPIMLDVTALPALVADCRGFRLERVEDLEGVVRARRRRSLWLGAGLGSCFAAIHGAHA